MLGRVGPRERLCLHKSRIGTNFIFPWATAYPRASCREPSFVTLTIRSRVPRDWRQPTPIRLDFSSALRHCIGHQHGQIGCSFRITLEPGSWCMSARSAVGDNPREMQASWFDGSTLNRYYYSRIIIIIIIFGSETDLGHNLSLLVNI